MKLNNQKFEIQHRKLQQEYEKNAEAIQQLRNRQKALLNQKRAEERKIRTHRLIETALLWKVCCRKLRI